MPLPSYSLVYIKYMLGSINLVCKDQIQMYVYPGTGLH